MIGQELVLVFKEDRAYLASDRPLSFGQLGLSDLATTFKAPAYWTIRVLSYQKEHQKLFCEIISYQNGTVDYAQHHKELAKQLQHIERVTFNSVDTTGLLKTMEGKAKEPIRPVRYLPVRAPRNTIETNGHSASKVRVSGNFLRAAQRRALQIGWCCLLQKIQKTSAYP